MKLNLGCGFNKIKTQASKWGWRVIYVTVFVSTFYAMIKIFGFL